MREGKRARVWWMTGGLVLAGAVGVVGAGLTEALTGDTGTGTRLEASEASEVSAGGPARPNGEVPMGGGRNQDGAADAGDGAIPSARTLTPFDTGHSALRNLDPDLLKAVQAAAKDAKKDGVDFFVTSGWRSKEYQQRLLDEGVVKYGGLERARQFVKTPETSEHALGKAIDIGPTNADDWLIRKGAAYGLCQIYNNEMWHFELRTRPGGTCPALKADATG
ncbi:M15 family metallopeptidase [Streptomyces sp. NPDC048442]|uniref:M15 family metallopeptidase n=1 Tax=Streptomyces sp. NPDC048442 TaxID=3154823 RepID=UPI003412963D